MRSIALLAIIGALSCAAAWAAEGPPPGAGTAAPLDYFVARLHLALGPDMTAEQRQVLLAHITSLTALYDQGVLFMAGPFDSGQDGLEIIRARSLEEARGYVEADPSVPAGVMHVLSVDKWWAAYCRPDNRRFTPEEMLQMMQPAAAVNPHKGGPAPEGALMSAPASGPAATIQPAPAAPTTGQAPRDGALVHFELPSTDFAQTQDFYGKLFGWTFQSMGGMYLLFQTPGGEGGGFTQDYKPADGGGTFYIYSADVAAKLAEVKTAGGSVELDTLGIPGYGWIAVFKDPQGNRVGLFSALNPQAGESPVPEMGHQS